MINLPSLKKKPKLDVDLKNRVLKNNDAILEAFGKNMDRAKCCPLLGGQKCIGALCEHFMEFTSINRETGQEIPYTQCAHTKTPMLLIELNQNIRELINAKNG